MPRMTAQELEQFLYSHFPDTAHRAFKVERVDVLGRRPRAGCARDGNVFNPARTASVTPHTHTPGLFATGDSQMGDNQGLHRKAGSR